MQNGGTALDKKNKSILLPATYCISKQNLHCNLFVITQVHLKKFDYHEKGKYFLESESETHILYRFITHRVKYVKPFFL